MPIQESELIDTVKRVLADVTHDDAVLEMDLDTQLREDLGIDSMTSLTFLMALEDAVDGFFVDATTLEAEHFQTIGSIYEYVRTQLSTAKIA
ncbi:MULTISPECIES: acyl carrier protein [Micromonospora]|uniref:Acyl carrier protein n=1 Tax=Micromonospora aurantiaca (nom. illeg.) TaxID=47850 RepID=A0A6N3K6I7_9ACTN|nr:MULTISPECIES: acyl carrier protein [Micromonospora]ADL47376.1 phosphopantetheine-binding [Micromonospora aurantiaca ATCC 27029]AXH93272.1 acyl carrier protein [Micromonospora aurantiaca]MBC9000555.1 acyl carrier protein [Micromonospora aurantiaca]OHX01667.1 acyl carrier protein [Micromonospora sp. WMMB235]UFN92142.1 acyl carrier protein [Micromonospora aurantiaca]